MEPTFLFYDIETSGLNPAFDQILSFACIRTTQTLDILDKHSFFIRPRRDVIPSAAAFLTHRLEIDELKTGVSEYEAAKTIHALLNQPGTISIGYNTMGFDDEFLRFTFYRNLFDPYSHQYANGCSRQDVFPITTVYRVFNPHVLSWPGEDKNESLKLEDICVENRFVTTGRAHEALNDVEATIELARCLMSEKKMWTYCLGFFNKVEDEKRFNSIKSYWKTDFGQFKLGILVSAKYGSKANFLVPVAYIGESVPYAKQHIWLPLNQDLALYFKDETMPFAIRKRFGDHQIILPALERFRLKICDEHQNMMAGNLNEINRNPDLFAKLIESILHYKYPHVENLDIDASLYAQGFFTFQEKKEIQKFHQAPDKEKESLINGFRSPRIRQFALRIIARNGISQSSNPDKEYQRHMAAVVGEDGQLCDVKGYKNESKLNKKEGLKALTQAKHGLDDSDMEGAKIIQDLEDYIQGLSL